MFCMYCLFALRNVGLLPVVTSGPRAARKLLFYVLLIVCVICVIVMLFIAVICVWLIVYRIVDVI